MSTAYLDSIRRHLTIIRETADLNGPQLQSLGEIEAEATALESALEAERARVGRLQGALRALGSLVDHLGRGESAHYPSMLSEDAKVEMGLHPDDLPDEEATR